MATLSPGFDPSLRTADEVATEARTLADAGLTTSEATARLERDGANQLVERRAVPLWRRVLRHFADPLVYLLLAATAIALTAWWIEGRQWRNKVTSSEPPPYTEYTM